MAVGLKFEEKEMNPLMDCISYLSGAFVFKVIFKILLFVKKRHEINCAVKI